ncbi:MAG: hypothetical protein HUJ56_04290, partial [Erysipelotrichaceae bacterium]|nr:hypothetical protein [Erysipelotrichaceae bacterium]
MAQNIKNKGLKVALAGLMLFSSFSISPLQEVHAEETTVLDCTLTEHTHTNACYDDNALLCTKSEHTHSDTCYDDT